MNLADAMLSTTSGLRSCRPGGIPLVLVRLGRVGTDRLNDLITDAWRMRKES